ncbi:MAG: FAD-dependent oxidoreductase [Ruminococcus bromii]|nr:FAD-dependent oxidoreductase [Ruminococcus bromii]
MNYLWTEGVHPATHKKLEGEISTEVCVIGGGMVGILCAARLTECGIDNILVEAKEIGRGITKGTTAVLTAQHDLPYVELAKKYDEERAKQYLNANLEAVEKFRKSAEKIDCDMETCPSVMYSLTGEDNLREEAEFVNGLGFPAVYTSNPKLPFAVADAVIYPDMAQFHPLKFLNTAAKNLNIYSNTFVNKIDGKTAFTDDGRINAKKYIIATHFPFINQHGMFFMKQYQKRSYVIAYKNAPQIHCTANMRGGFYFRNYKDLLLIGGGDHRTGKKGGGYEAVEEFALSHFQGAKEAYRWSNQDCITLDNIPYIGIYSKSLPDVYVATGFNHWGMTTSMAAADILCDMVQGKSSPYSKVFAPDRSVMHPQLFCNLGATVADFVIPTTKRCSHLGCALRYNKAEHSWDCPCHGSRFDENGSLIDNPAMRNANV